VTSAQRTTCCVTCHYFDDSVAAIEAALPGLSSLGSAYAAVRSADGLCQHHDRYVASSSHCAAHLRRGQLTARAG
jgi:hypothetical protein